MRRWLNKAAMGCILSAAVFSTGMTVAAFLYAATGEGEKAWRCFWTAISVATALGFIIGAIEG